MFQSTQQYVLAELEQARSEIKELKAKHKARSGAYPLKVMLIATIAFMLGGLSMLAALYLITYRY